MVSSSQLTFSPKPLDLSLAHAMKRRILGAALSRNTMRGYRCSWNSFSRWCREAGVQSLPATPQTCIDHAAWCIAEKRRVETVLLRLKAIHFYHQQRKLTSPVDQSVREFMRNAKRELRERPQGKHAITPEHLKSISKSLLARGGTKDIRDRAILLLCFACGWRCSELVSLDLRDVRWVDDGIILWLGKSKTDQEGRGRSVGIQHGSRELTCPIKALEKWLEARGRWAGPLFTQLFAYGGLTERRLDSDGVRKAVKRSLELIGEDPTHFGAHSLRVGMITAAVEAGATETSVMQRTGHRQYETLLRYVRPAQAFRANPLKGVL